MQIIGFDVSKEELLGVRINRRSEIKEKYLVINRPRSVQKFLDKLSACRPKAVIGSEATSEYHNILAKLCVEKEIPFYLLNPIVTKRFTKATIRKKKTDLTDAHVIAQCVLMGEGELVCSSYFSPLKPMLRTCSRLSEMESVFSLMRRGFQEHFQHEVSVQKELAMLEKETAASIKRIKEYSRKYTDSRAEKLLLSIPGIGKTLAPLFLSEIGDIERFKNAKSLIAFSGLDPKIRQSGSSLKRSTKLTKRGSPYLRKAAFLAASIAQRHDPEFKEYFEKKKNEGKRYTEATVANARHILSRIYAVWKRGTPYIPKT